MKRFYLAFATFSMLSLLFVPVRMEAQVEWISTTNSKPWLKNQVKLIRLSNSKTDATIIPEVKEQTINGFGACFNELGWTALSVLDEQGRETILKNLFDPNEGLKLNICRMPVGANDYARPCYLKIYYRSQLSMGRETSNTWCTCKVPVLKVNAI